MSRVLVDTSVWSLALRRSVRQLDAIESRLTHLLRDLIIENRACLIGPIRQELLSGVRDVSDFELLQRQLDAITHIELRVDDFDQAASFYNSLQRVGVSGGAIDLLVCAVAFRYDLSIVSTDRDFENYARHLPIALYRTG